MFRPQSEIVCWESILGKDLKLRCRYICSASTFSVKSDLGLCAVEQHPTNCDKVCVDRATEK